MRAAGKRQEGQSHVPQPKEPSDAVQRKPIHEMSREEWRQEGDRLRKGAQLRRGRGGRSTSFSASWDQRRQPAKKTRPMKAQTKEVPWKPNGVVPSLCRCNCGESIDDYRLVVPGVVVGLIMLVAQFRVGILQAKRTLVREEAWRAKKDAFSTAIRLFDQCLTTHTPGNTAVNLPTPLEINSAYAQLMLTADSADIPRRFVSVFLQGSNPSPAGRAEFITLLRKELFDSTTQLKPEEVLWVG